MVFWYELGPVSGIWTVWKRNKCWHIIEDSVAVKGVFGGTETLHLAEGNRKPARDDDLGGYFVLLESNGKI